MVMDGLNPKLSFDSIFKIQTDMCRLVEIKSLIQVDSFEINFRQRYLSDRITV